MEFNTFLRLLALYALVITHISVQASDHGIPKQIKRIYRRYKKGNLPNNGVNTVRHIAAHKGSVTSNGKLLFNLNAIHKQETLIKAELYFYRKPSLAMTTLRLKFSEISPYYHHDVQQETIEFAKKGWQTVDITRSVNKCTNTILTNNQLGVSFAQLNDQKLAQPVNMAMFLRHHGLPFIITYSNNTQSLEMDQITGRSGLNEKQFAVALSSLVDPEYGVKSDKEHKKLKRERRSLFDNKLPLQNDKMKLKELERRFNQIPTSYNHLPNAEDFLNELTNEIELSPNDVKKKQSAAALQEQEVESSTAALSTALPQFTRESISKDKERVKKNKHQLIPWPTLKKPARKKKNKLKGLTKIPTNWHDINKAKAKNENMGCHRESLRLNFEDIGWGLRVIEPKKFDAYYCKGQCEFPYSLGMKPTNHATLQSLLSSIRSHADIPEPCCVPDKLSPVTLMYYDQYDNIVVKIYKDMSVESCSCR